MTIIAQIKTTYVVVGHSNVGGYRATGMGKQRTNRSNQQLSSAENHIVAAERLARAILDQIAPDERGDWAVEEFDSNDAGTERLWRLVKIT